MKRLEKPKKPNFSKPWRHLSKEEKAARNKEMKEYYVAARAWAEEQKALGWPTDTREDYFVKVSGVQRLDITDSQGRTNINLGEADLAVPGVIYEYGSDPGENLIVPHQLVLRTDGVFDVKFETTSDIMEIEIARGRTETLRTMFVSYLDMHLPVGVIAWLRFSPEGVQDLKYDADGDGVFESSLVPTYSLTGTAALDVTAPELDIAADVTGTNALITMTASDSETGVRDIQYQVKGEAPQTYTAPFSVDLSQSKMITAFAEDNAGNRRSALKVLDLKAPSTTAATSPDVSGIFNWASSAVEVTLSAKDDVGGSGVKELVYSASGATEISETRIPVNRPFFEFPRPATPDDVAEVPLTISEEGLTTLTYFAVDRNGNAESPKTLQVGIDYSSPRSNASIDIFENVATISLSASDVKLVYNPVTEMDEPDPSFPVSGVRFIKYSIDGGEYKTYQSPVIYVGTGSGSSHSINFYSVDIAGNIENERTANFSVSASVTPKGIKPFVECVEWKGDYRRARFGYTNFNSESVTIPVGQDNRFTPGNENLGQATTFLPGQNFGAFEIVFSGPRIIWELRGPDGVLNIAMTTLKPGRCV
ncbi:MAG: hypothetical protein AB7V18_13285 [Pyrinomonadaceae bacterium]